MSEEVESYVQGIINFETMSLEEAMDLLIRLGMARGLVGALSSSYKRSNMQLTKAYIKKTKDRIRTIVWSGE